jgi:carbamoyl-phosphate synthase large subunit
VQALARKTKARCLRRRGVSLRVVLDAAYDHDHRDRHSRYSGETNDTAPFANSLQKTVMVIGSGVYRIGSSVEFDYCSVEAVKTLRRLGYKTIMLNYNPETVSTDYDESDKLFFEEISLERVLDIYDAEKPHGVVVSVGGQAPNNMATRLHAAGVKILGTTADSIDNCEDRDRYSSMLDTLGIKQPEWCLYESSQQTRAFCDRVGYPVLIRPSCVHVFCFPFTSVAIIFGAASRRAGWGTR